ncbi:hypothetical protein SAY87_003269 [Trapa incisa]|uniref:NADH dehydrogenase [ubiquinone] 1 alpha subcomplex subunit 12 n=1 Tax=Trapa incisa TaxID=236973 RepID=A0AAN7KNW8_9MYRT|nr:hypothetical protein SAY87_003269 [Trapa incisa]
MSKIFSRIAGFFSNRTQAGLDKAGNRYFTRIEEIDGIMKEKRWVVFKGESDPTSVPVEWICWLNGQRKKAPTPEEMAELEARREQVKQNVARLKEEEQRKLKEGIVTGKVGGPDLQSFIRQFPSTSEEDEPLEKEKSGKFEETREHRVQDEDEEILKSSEPTGSGATFKPGTWQPPT